MSVKLSATSSEPSLAVTVSSSTPLKSWGGVPVKVAPSKLSQSGRAAPSDKVAVNDSVSPSGSTNVPSGIEKLIVVSSSTAIEDNGPPNVGAGVCRPG